MRLVGAFRMVRGLSSRFYEGVDLKGDAIGQVSEWVSELISYSRVYMHSRTLPYSSNSSKQTTASELISMYVYQSINNHS